MLTEAGGSMKKPFEDILALYSNTGHDTVQNYAQPSLDHFSKIHKSYKLLPEYSASRSEKMSFLITSHPTEMLRLENFSITVKLESMSNDNTKVGWDKVKLFLIENLIFDTIFEDIRISIDNTLVWKNTMDRNRYIYQHLNNVFSAKVDSELPKIRNYSQFREPLKSANFNKWQAYTATVDENAKLTFTHDISGLFPFGTTQGRTLRTLTGQKFIPHWLHPGARIHIELTKRKDIKSLFCTDRNPYENIYNAELDDTTNLDILNNAKLELVDIAVNAQSYTPRTQEQIAKFQGQKLWRYLTECPTFIRKSIESNRSDPDLTFHIPPNTNMFFLVFPTTSQLVFNQTSKQSSVPLYSFPRNCQKIRIYLDDVEVLHLTDPSAATGYLETDNINFMNSLVKSGLWESTDSKSFFPQTPAVKPCLAQVIPISLLDFNIAEKGVQAKVKTLFNPPIDAGFNFFCILAQTRMVTCKKTDKNDYIWTNKQRDDHEKV